MSRLAVTFNPNACVGNLKKKIITIKNYDVTPANDVLLYLSLLNESRCCNNLDLAMYNFTCTPAESLLHRSEYLLT